MSSMERMAVVDGDRRMRIAMLAAAGALLLGGLAAGCDNRGGDAGDGDDLQRAYGTDSAAQLDPLVQRMPPDVFDLNTLGLVEQTHS